ncbi:Methyl-accepting chemotaxis protein [Halanaerobium saccharolyticum subsp. saccharolyticum DSM 6643]|uniref:Methyl-accepting chemotaxis protein n=2 Tax=Halanaerobium saccharolyticum TaxID=43595 RepID=M5E0H1_9FIRM|nr:Methyl-accepting chemotaxis protein [Halanaerobium saccharolyticum subsp. saccharolyticum DSM 6643]
MIEDSFVESTKREVSQVDNAINLYFEQLKSNTRFLVENEYIKQVEDNVTKYLNNQNDSLMMTPSENGGVEEDIYYLFDDFAKTHPEVSYIYIGTKYGGMIQHPEGVVGSNYDPRERPFYEVALANEGQVVLTEPYYWEADDTINIGAVSTFNNSDGEFIGVLGIDIGLNSLTNLIKDITIGEEGFIILVDDQNNILAHPREASLTFENVSALGVEELSSNLDQDSKAFEAVMNGEEYLFNTYKSDGTSWNFISVIPKSELEAQINQMYKQIITIIIVLLILISLLALFISKKISDPIIEATNFSKEIAAGNLNAEKIKVKGNNELSILSEALNEMQEDLKDMISQINNIALDLSSSSEELSASGEGLEHSAEKVGESIEHVASGAEEQSAQTEESTALVSELSKEIDNIDKMSKNMKTETKVVMENIEEGSVSMDTSIDQIESVNQNTAEVSDSIGELGILSEEIGNIVNLINGIASQTNLLALNAAIEAARAGEAGRGFSVVADEIRNLAEESSKATEKIEELIKDIQEGVDNSVGKMNETEEVVQSSVDVIEKTKLSFDKVKEVSMKLSQIIENIDLKTNKVNTKGKEVAEIINQIASVSEESAQRSEEVASYSQEQLNSTKEVVRSAKTLAETAEKLTETVNKFNL